MRTVKLFIRVGRGDESDGMAFRTRFIKGIRGHKKKKYFSLLISFARDLFRARTRSAVYTRVRAISPGKKILSDMESPRRRHARDGKETFQLRARGISNANRTISVGILYIILSDRAEDVLKQCVVPRGFEYESRFKLVRIWCRRNRLKTLF